MMDGIIECLPWDVGDMAGFAGQEYSKREIVAAGEVLAREIAYASDPRDIDQEIVTAFRIAHAWRGAHVTPMRNMRAELYWAAKGIGVTAIAAARLKRMRSIRKKLKNTPLSLYQIQDIGGCRAIVDSIADCEKLLALYRAGRSRHRVSREDPYIETPRKTGYRSHHFRLKFNGEGENEIYNRQTIELQIRTRLQHAWATAVEAVGLVRGEDLKGGDGDKDWLRLFVLAASEIALVEGCAPVPGLSESESERREELRELDRKLAATACLSRWNTAIDYTNSLVSQTPGFYLIRFENVGQESRVTVRPYGQFAAGAAELAKQESAASGDTVLVELQEAQDLKAAYPNYFLDVSIFNAHLKAFVAGTKPPALSAIDPQPKPTPKIDFSFGRWGR